MAGKGQITRARRGRRREHPQPFVLLHGKMAGNPHFL